MDAPFGLFKNSKIEEKTTQFLPPMVKLKTHIFLKPSIDYVCSKQLEMEEEAKVNNI